MSCDCDVLVVGLGPVGAALCALLAREGVTAIAVERDGEVYPLPRAAHFDHEIMRLFQKLEGQAITVIALQGHCDRAVLHHHHHLIASNNGRTRDTGYGIWIEHIALPQLFAGLRIECANNAATDANECRPTARRDSRTNNHR